MSKTLVLAEKPSVGKDIGKVLHCTPRGNQYMEGKDYIVTWAFGHLVTLAGPEKHNKKYEKWDMADLPIIPKTIQLEIIKKTRSQYETVKKLMLSKGVSEIVIATDAGREGELVARWIIKKAGVKKRIKRLWISSVTDQAIKNGFNNLKDGKAYENLYASAVARAESDWLVGLNASRALTCKYNAQLSCGRVQTPTLGMISKREDEIIKFKPIDYYGIQFYSGGMKYKWINKKTNDYKSYDLKGMENIYENIKNKKATVKQVKTVEKKSYAPLLYDLTELQKDANQMFQFSAKETLNIMQNLYEYHKVLTYPRTDSRYLTDDMVSTLKDRLRAMNTGEYSQLVGPLIRQPLKANKHFVDNKKVTDHHAIIPTEQTVFLGDLTHQERKIYDLVVRRFVAVLMNPHVFDEMQVEVNIDQHVFVAKGKVIKDIGWQKALKKTDVDKDSNNDEINQLKNNMMLSLTQVKMVKDQTAPPTRFTEGTLLKAMEKPLHFMVSHDEKLLKTIKESGGLGTVATRADIIEKLFHSQLIEQRGKYIHITHKGQQLLQLVPKDLKTPELTAQWELALQRIAEGKVDQFKFINDIEKYTKEIIREIKMSQQTYKHDNLTRTKCPECDQFLLEIKNKHGVSFVCQDRSCGYRKKVSQATKARCPNCHKPMNLVGEGENKKFVCKCGHSEKLTAFNKRKAEKKNEMSKKDMANYLNNQKDEEFNNPFAAALKNIKIED